MLLWLASVVLSHSATRRSAPTCFRRSRLPAQLDSPRRSSPGSPAACSSGSDRSDPRRGCQVWTISNHADPHALASPLRHDPAVPARRLAGPAKRRRRSRPLVGRGGSGATAWRSATMGLPTPWRPASRYSCWLSGRGSCSSGGYLAVCFVAVFLERGRRLCVSAHRLRDEPADGLRQPADARRLPLRRLCPAVRWHVPERHPSFDEAFRTITTVTVEQVGILAVLALVGVVGLAWRRPALLFLLWVVPCNVDLCARLPGHGHRPLLPRADHVRRGAGRHRCRRHR